MSQQQFFKMTTIIVATILWNNKGNPKNLNLTNFKEDFIFFWRKICLKLKILRKLHIKNAIKLKLGVIFLEFLKKSRLSIWIWLLLKKIWTKIWKKSYCVFCCYCHYCCNKKCVMSQQKFYTTKWTCLLARKALYILTLLISIYDHKYSNFLLQNVSLLYQIRMYSFCQLMSVTF